METILKILIKIQNLFRNYFKLKVVTITCITQSKGKVITHLGGTINGEEFTMSKGRLIFKLISYENSGFKVKIKTKGSQEIQIVNYKYFRVKGNDELIDNLTKLPRCK